MSEYPHWHRDGEVNTETPPCCVTAIEDVWRNRIAAAEHAERRRVILGAAQAIQTYGDAAASVLAETEAALVKTVTDKAIAAIKATGCICPLVDVGNFADPSATMRGFDRGFDRDCGMHEVRP